MFELYTERARRVVFFARDEAGRHGSPYIETEHLLLALLREDAPFWYRIAKHGQIESVRGEIESQTAKRPLLSTSVEVPLSKQCAQVLRHAVSAANKLGQRHVGTEHLFLQLLCEKRSLASQIMRSHSVETETILRAIAERSSDPGADEVS